MLADMVPSTSNFYVIQFTDGSGHTWFDCNVFDNWRDAVKHAQSMREVKGFCESFSVRSILYWLKLL